MERHHEVALMQALDLLYLTGTTSILWGQLYLWFKAERLGKNAYRTILSRWEDLCVEVYKQTEAPSIDALVTPAYLTLVRRAFGGSKEEWFDLSDKG